MSVIQRRLHIPLSGRLLTSSADQLLVMRELQSIKPVKRVSMMDSDTVSSLCFPKYARDMIARYITYPICTITLSIDDICIFRKDIYSLPFTDFPKDVLWLARGIRLVIDIETNISTESNLGSEIRYNLHYADIYIGVRSNGHFNKGYSWPYKI